MAESGPSTPSVDLNTEKIKEWRSIITLIVFVFTNIIVLSPFKAPIYIPRIFRDGFVGLLSSLRIISPRPANPKRKAVSPLGLPLVRFDFPVNFVTAPVAANCFLLAILAIGREEVAAGTIGADDIVPIDIMVFFVTLAYMAISLDATGLIRWLAYKVLSWGGKTGRRLFFFLYLFWFALTGVVGNDPTILSGTPFLAYVTRVAKNIDSPRAWIFTQFAMANVASAILVSSNPTNLVLAGAFQIKFIEYTANIIVPVLATVVLLFPFLLFVVFRDEALVPRTIDMHELPEEARNRKPVNPNIPKPEDDADAAAATEGQGNQELLSLEEIMNPYLDKWSACFIAGLLGLALIIVLVLNAVTAASGAHYPVFWVTLPAAGLAFAFDMVSGWMRRHETREIAAQNRRNAAATGPGGPRRASEGGESMFTTATTAAATNSSGSESGSVLDLSGRRKESEARTGGAGLPMSEIQSVPQRPSAGGDPEKAAASAAAAEGRRRSQNPSSGLSDTQRTTLSSLAGRFWAWMRETFPNASHTLGFLPWALVPFAFAMFILVQALATKGWIPVFAYGWDHWVGKTGTVGAIGGMGFLSVVLCNFAGTNIGTTILLCRVIQAWQAIHEQNGIPISDRTFWATVYSMAIGVNYGAFSFAFSGALAGLLWRDVLAKKHIHIGNREFAWVNLPIIAFCMVIGLSVLVGEVYIIRGDAPYNAA